MELIDLTEIWPEWQIEKQIGIGSFGSVYKAVCNRYGISSNAAIKKISIPSDSSELEALKYEGMSTSDSKKYFKSIVDNLVGEISMMETLKGASNIVCIEDYKVVEKKDTFGWDIYIRMELLTKLNDFMCDKDVCEDDVIKLGIDLCNALEVCGKKNIIHRDIKPENIFVNDFGEFKLGDFGVAKKLEYMNTNLSQKGTFGYMAPEVVKGYKYDSRVDIYSLGLVMYKLMNNNRLPFLNPNKQILNYTERQTAVERRIRGEELLPPINASTELGHIILKACAYDVNNRYSSPSKMKEALQRLKFGDFFKGFCNDGYSDADQYGNNGQYFNEGQAYENSQYGAGEQYYNDNQAYEDNRYDNEEYYEYQQNGQQQNYSDNREFYEYSDVASEKKAFSSADVLNQVPLSKNEGYDVSSESDVSYRVKKRNVLNSSSKAKLLIAGIVFTVCFIIGFLFVMLNDRESVDNDMRYAYVEGYSYGVDFDPLFTEYPSEAINTYIDYKTVLDDSYIVDTLYNNELSNLNIAKNTLATGSYERAGEILFTALEKRGFLKKYMEENDLSLELYEEMAVWIPGLTEEVMAKALKVGQIEGIDYYVLYSDSNEDILVKEALKNGEWFVFAVDTGDSDSDFLTKSYYYFNSSKEFIGCIENHE